MNTRDLYQVIIVDVWNNYYELGWYGSTEEASEAVGQYIKNDFFMNTPRLVDKDGKPLTEDQAKALLSVPDDFIKEYPSTFSTCFDRSLSYSEIAEECFKDENGEQQVFLADDSYDDFAFEVRGFIHGWPEELADEVLKLYDKDSEEYWP